jgi:hypothetical protein
VMPTKGRTMKNTPTAPRNRAAWGAVVLACTLALLPGCQNSMLNDGPFLEADIPVIPSDPCPAPSGLDIILNEVMLVNLGSVVGPESNDQPWIELYNPTTEPFDLGGMTISDDLSDPEKWEFPCGSDELLEPGEYLVLFFSDQLLSDTDLVIDFLPAETGEVRLALYWQGATEQTPLIEADALPFDGSIGWTPDFEWGTFEALLTPTPSAANSESLVPPAATFIRGDLDADLDVDVDDLALLEAMLFEEGAPLPACVDRADVNDDGVLDIGDLNFLVIALGPGGPTIPAPFAAVGVDPTDDTLPCEHEVIP